MKNITIRRKRDKRNITDKLMGIRTKEIVEESFDSSVIHSDLLRIGVDNELSKDIVCKTEVVVRSLMANGVKSLSSSLVRSIVNDVLSAVGIKKQIDDGKIYIDIEDYKSIVGGASKDNSNFIANNPEMISFSLNEKINKKLLLETDYIFSEEVRKAHFDNRIFIHDSGQPHRLYCSSHSMPFISKNILELPTVATRSKPAKYADVLMGHLKTFLCTYQVYFSGAVGIPYFNIFVAPYVVGMRDKEIKQFCQNIMFSLAQTAFNKGSQALFMDLGINLYVPSYFANTKAIGPGGKYIEKDGRTLVYKDFEKEAQLIAKYIFETCEEGDCDGRPYTFPKILCHVDDTCFKDEGALFLLKQACKLSSTNGTTYFIFDRDDKASVAMCCRLSFGHDNIKPEMFDDPSFMRFCAGQNISINLPHIAYCAMDNYKNNGAAPMLSHIFSEIDKVLDIAVCAHIQKKEAAKKYMKVGGPLYDLSRNIDGKPYMDIENITWLMGIIGLNNAIQYIFGKQLHESKEAFDAGLSIIKYMNFRCEQLSKKHNMRFILEETPGESACSALAQNDYNLYSNKFDNMVNVLRGQDGYFYYESGVHLEEGNSSMIDRINIQSEFSPFIPAGSIIHIWLGEHKPNVDSLYNLVKKVFYDTKTREIVFTPDISVCKNNHVNIWNRCTKCPICGTEIDHYISRIVGYYSRVDKWNNAKISEFWKRKREAIK